MKPIQHPWHKYTHLTVSRLMVLWGAVVGLMSWYTIDGPSTMNDGKCAGEYPLHCLQKYMLKQKRTDWNRKCHLMRTLHICWSKLPQKKCENTQKGTPFPLWVLVWDRLGIYLITPREKIWDLKQQKWGMERHCPTQINRSTCISDRNPEL